MEVRFLSLGSGSSGNCYYLATKTCGILIDAGIGIRSIKKIFKDYALNLDTIRAVLITHDKLPTILKLSDIWQKSIAYPFILHRKCTQASIGVIA